jgi:sugar-specific transcriptional regulator TrmB
MLEEKLHHLGLGKNEIKVYLALLELGKSKAGSLVEYCRLHRNLVYQSLELLRDKGLITKTEIKGIATFSANSPESLVSKAEESVDLAKEVAAELLEKGVRKTKEVAVYEGTDGIIRATMDKLNAPEGETFYLLGASQFTISEPFMNWKAFHKKRIEKKIKFRALYDRTVGQSVLDERNKLPLSEAKYLPFNLKMPVWFDICNDSVAIMVPDGLVFNIKSKPAAEAMKQYFEYLWNPDIEKLNETNAVPISEGKAGK